LSTQNTSTAVVNKYHLLYCITEKSAENNETETEIKGNYAHLTCH